MMKLDYPLKLMKGLKEVIERCVKSSYMTTSITINTRKIGQSGETYNNNTPFDMGMALLNLNTDVNTIEEIISVYIDNQESEGSWFLSFSSAYTNKTWTTSEALIFLELATKKYRVIKNAEIETHAQQIINEITRKFEEKENQLSVQKIQFEQKCKECENKCKRICSEQKSLCNSILKAAQRYSTTSAVISCVLSILLGTALVIISQSLSETHPLASNVLNVLLIPIIGNVFYDIFKTIKINKSDGGEQNDY